VAWQHSDAIWSKRVKGKGRGVFARRAIPDGTVIERVPVLLVPLRGALGNGHDSVLSRYCFLRSGTTVALALGYGSLYNHSYRPNARYEEDGPDSMLFRAIRDIAKGEEITINYNGEASDPNPVGFGVVP
jgi:SET domain-containing protein